MKLSTLRVPSNLDIMLGLDSVRKVADVDVFRVDGHSTEPAPWRAKVNGQYLLTQAGTVRKWRTMAEAIKATETLSAPARALLWD